MKKNNQGLTMVELIVCLTIFGILMAAVFGFMLAGSKTYTRVNDRLELNVQTQLTVGHITEHFIDCNFGVGKTDSAIYAVNKDESGGYTAYIYAMDEGGLLYGVASISPNDVSTDEFGLTTVKIAESAEHSLTKCATGLDLELGKYENQLFSTVNTGDMVDSVRLTIKAALGTAVSEETHEIALRNKPVLLKITG